MGHLVTETGRRRGLREIRSEPLRQVKVENPGIVERRGKKSIEAAEQLSRTQTRPEAGRHGRVGARRWSRNSLTCPCLRTGVEYPAIVQEY